MTRPFISLSKDSSCDIGRGEKRLIYKINSGVKDLREDDLGSILYGIKCHLE
jgi:hypothetical protein